MSPEVSSKFPTLLIVSPEILTDPSFRKSPKPLMIKTFLIRISLELSSLTGDVLAPMEKLTTLKKTKKKKL